MSDGLVPLRVGLTLDPTEVAESIVDHLEDSGVIAFILKIDNLMSDYDFTVRLRDALQNALDVEEAA